MHRTFIMLSLFLIYSFLGWVIESIYCFIVDKKFVDRGFLIGPVCPIYGCGCLLILVFLNKYKEDPLTLFCMSMIICSLLEYLTSYVMEKIFKTRWWDYSHKKFNLNGRVCLDNIVAFGVLGLLIVCFVNPFMVDILNMIDPILIKVVISILFVIFLIDLFVSTKIIYHVKGVGTTVLKDQTEEISAKVREVLLSKGIFVRRIANAFPDLKVKDRKIKK